MSWRLQEWFRAEAALGRPEDVMRAAKGLPDRLRWLFLAIAALDDGECEGIERVATDAAAAGHPDVAAVLEVVLQPPEALDPTEIRKQAKRAGLQDHSDMWFLDLLRALAAHRAGNRCSAGKALHSAAKERPALYAAKHVLTSSAARSYRFPECEDAFPRASQIAVMAGRYRSQGRTSWSPGPVHGVDPLRYVDGGTNLAQVTARLEGRRSWSHGHDPASNWLMSRPRAERAIWLGALAREIARRVAAVELHGLRGMVHVARHLAGDAQRPELEQQLGSLEVRLGALEGPSLDTELLILVWEERAKGLSPPERVLLARRLADRVDELPAEVHQSIRLLLAATEPGPQVPDLLLPWLSALSEAELESYRQHTPLEGDGWKWVRAMHRAVTEPGRGLAEARALAVEQPEWAAVLAALAVDGAGGEPRRALRRAMRSVAIALSAHRRAGWALPSLLRPLDDCPSEVAAAVESWAQEVPHLPDQVGEVLALLVCVGRDAAHAALLRLLRQEGKHYRRLEAEEADRRALAVLGTALGSAPGWSQEILEVLAPVSAFLQRAHVDRLLAYVDALGDVAIRGVELWVGAEPVFEESEAWMEWSGGGPILEFADEHALGLEVLIEQLERHGLDGQDLIERMQQALFT